MLADPSRTFEIRAEIAENRLQREQGLMFRKDLAENQGMLFVYQDLAARYVWMKNTLLQLDVLFLDADGRIVSKLERLLPCRGLTCDVFSSEKPAMFMLEVNAGFIETHRLKTGDIMRVSCP